jgi:hypothetical protein
LLLPEVWLGVKVMPPSIRREHQKVVAMDLNKDAGDRSKQSRVCNCSWRVERMAASFPH